MIEIKTSRTGNTAPGPGVLLIAHPFLKDPHFARTVTFLCDHSEEGSFGFTLNNLFSQTLGELMPDMVNRVVKVYVGGPVQLDTLHFIHQCPDLIQEGKPIKGDLYWGGNFEQAIALINNGSIGNRQIKFFVGYSGWGAGQLQNELKEDAWIISKVKKRLLFSTNEINLWASALKSMGKDYGMMANFPIDPTLN